VAVPPLAGGALDMEADSRHHGECGRRRQLRRCHSGSCTAAANALHVRVEGASVGEGPHAVIRGGDGSRRGGGGGGAGASDEHRLADCRVAGSRGSVARLSARIIKLWRRPDSAVTVVHVTATGVAFRWDFCRRGREGWEGGLGGCTAFGPASALHCLVFDQAATKHRCSVSTASCLVVSSFSVA